MKESEKVFKRNIVKKVKRIADFFTNNEYVPSNDPGLFTGKTGLALFLFYYSIEFGDQRKYNKAVRLLKNALNKDMVECFNPSFSGGVAGISWIANFFHENDFVTLKFHDFFESTDKLVFLAGKKYIRNKNWDYLHGAMGVGIYFLARRTDFADEFLDFFVDELHDNARYTDKGAFVIIDHNIDDNLRIDLGLAHGLAGMLIFLSKLYLKGINTVKSMRLIQGICEFLIACRQDIFAAGSYYPNWITNPDNPEMGFSRLSWCYGDIGVGLSLFFAGNATGNDFWLSNGLNLLKDTTKRRDLNNNCIVDAGFCHGTSGLSYVYKRIFDITADSVFIDASRYWAKMTIKMAKHPDGIAGYKTCKSQQINIWKCDSGLLEGIAGIGLSLLVHITDQNQNWDECMMLR